MKDFSQRRDIIWSVSSQMERHVVNCRLINTTLAFEYSDVDAEITGKVGSVFNPRSGTIKADRIDELIIEKDKIDPDKTKIICNNIGKQSDRPEWLQ